MSPVKVISALALAAVWSVVAPATASAQSAGQCAAYFAASPRDRSAWPVNFGQICVSGTGQITGSELPPGLAGSLNDPGQQRRETRSERYVPTIWVDPDGCQHWVMDDGWEGFMTPNVTPDGIPVCNRGNPCLIANADQLFATDRHAITRSGRANLEAFFRGTGATAYIIEGHTDSRASDEYNMGLSLRRAKAVAAVAQSVGVRVAAIRGYGEREPRATNRTRAGMALNRRVEIQCIR